MVSRRSIVQGLASASLPGLLTASSMVWAADPKTLEIDWQESLRKMLKSARAGR
jgi:hypothetical protein